MLLSLIILVCIPRFYLQLFTVLHREVCLVHLYITDKEMEAQPAGAELGVLGVPPLEPPFFVFPLQDTPSTG